MSPASGALPTHRKPPGQHHAPPWIPVPGEWHWTWHILQGIFKLYGTYILTPFAKKLGFKSFDVFCQDFHYGEEVLQMVTLATMKWI